MTPPTTLVDSISVRVPKVRVASPSIRPFWGACFSGSPERVEAVDDQRIGPDVPTTTASSSSASSTRSSAVAACLVTAWTACSRISRSRRATAGSYVLGVTPIAAETPRVKRAGYRSNAERSPQGTEGEGPPRRHRKGSAERSSRSSKPSLPCPPPGDVRMCTRWACSSQIWDGGR